MKKFIGLAMAGTLCLGTAYAQTTLDDFEGGLDGWAETGGYTTFSLITNDGADSTVQSMELNDAGWSKGATKTFTGVVPADGNYKVTFYYKNGDQSGQNPWPGLGVRLNGGGDVVLGSAQVTTWTAGETGVVTGLTAGGDVTVEVFGLSSAQAANQCRFDQFALEEVAVVPITARVTPLDGEFLAGVATITVEPSGGTGTYASVAFDIGNDGNVESTDTTPGDGFTYSWDTGTDDGPIAVKVTVTDDGSNTGEEIVNYTLANTEGREPNQITNGDFELWNKQGAPVGWTRVDIDDAGAASPTELGTIAQDTTDPFEGASCLSIDYAENPSPFRYTIISNSFPGNRKDYVVTGAFKGNSYVRVYLFVSEDGVTWATTSQGLSPSAGAAWKEAVSAPYSPGAPTTYMALVTHYYGTGTGYWDDLAVTMSLPPTAVQTWDIY